MVVQDIILMENSLTPAGSLSADELLVGFLVGVMVVSFIWLIQWNFFDLRNRTNLRL